MIQSSVDNPRAGEAKLPQRDWILLPLLGVVTIAVLVVVLNRIANRTFPQPDADIYLCVTGNSQAAHLRGIPNVVCKGSDRDTPVTEYRLNSCGHRSAVECGTRSGNAYRIVLVGTSSPLGEGVALDESYAVKLPVGIEARTGRRVELYNEGMFSELPPVIHQYFAEIIAEKPEVILWVLTPHDLLVDPHPAIDPSAQPRSHLGFVARTRIYARQAFATERIPAAISDIVNHLLEKYSDAPSLILLQHFLYRSQYQYVRSYLEGSPDVAFLKADPSAEMRRHLQEFASDYAAIETQARVAHIPLLTVLLPNRAQAAMVSMDYAPPGFDPYLLDRELRSIVETDGGIYMDVLPSFRTIPNPEQYFYPVNGHPDARGNALIANLLADDLTGGPVPELRAAPEPQAAWEKR